MSGKYSICIKKFSNRIKNLLLDVIPHSLQRKNKNNSPFEGHSSISPFFKVLSLFPPFAKGARGGFEKRDENEKKLQGVK